MTDQAQDEAVAVVIPTYNHAHFLSAALKSVLCQTHPAAEIIVIDDGSHDHPEKVVAEFPGVRIIRQDNAGLAAARNAGAKASSAPFLLFLDADDRLKLNCIELGLELLRRDPGAAFSYGAYELVYATGERRAAQFLAVPRTAFAQFLNTNPIGMHGTVLYRRAPLEATGGFRVELPACEDYDIYLRLARDHPILCRGEILAEYWHHDTNMSRDPAFMLRWCLRVLNARKGDAETAGLKQALVAGKHWWRQHYAGIWFGNAKAGPRNLQLYRQGLSLFLMAPGTMIGIVLRRISNHIRWMLR